MEMDLELDDIAEDNIMTGDNKAKNIREVRRKYFVLACGFMMVYGPFQSVIMLQSSINIEEGKGTLAVGAAYGISVLVALFVTPVAVRRIGVKWVLIIGEITYILYMAANFYPKKWIMMSAGMILGFGEALVWTAAPVFLWYFGISHGKFGTKDLAVYIRKYTAIFFAACQFGQVFGNAVTYGILYGIKNQNSTRTNDMAAIENASSRSHVTKNEFEHCGANDCFNSDNMTTENLEKFVPANIISLYILMSTFCVIAVCSVLLQTYLLPKARMGHLTTEVNNNNFLCEKEMNEKGREDDGVKYNTKTRRSYRSTLVATCKHMLSYKQLLMSPISMYDGLLGSFTYGQATRSYASCILGVETLGMVALAYCTVNGFASTMSPSAIGKFGRRKVTAAIFLLDICNYIFCLLWTPGENTKFFVLIIFVGLAITRASWKNIVVDGYTDFFPHNQEISFTAWNAWLTLGLATGFLWGPLFCVRVKLYIHMGMLTFSTICFGTAEYIHTKK